MCESVCTPIKRMFLSFYVCASGDFFLCVWMEVGSFVCVLLHTCMRMLFYMLNVPATGCGLYVLTRVLAILFLAWERLHSSARLKPAVVSIGDLVPLCLKGVNPTE